jgi:heptosyltransferase-2
MRGVRNIIENPIGHRELRLRERRVLAERLRGNGYARALVLPNSFKSALIPWLARIPRRIGYVREARGILLTDARRLDSKALPRLVDRFVALAAQPGELVPTSPAKRWPAEHFITLARRFIDSGYVVWLVGSPNDRVAADPIAAAIPEVRNVCGRTDLGTAIDLLATASVVVSNDSGLMHAAAAVGRPLVALFGSSSPDYTPPLSPLARVAKIDIVCSPCFQRECPLGHFKCMRELSPNLVYDLARTQR